ncbi:Glycerol-3-phosphate acyltransferase 3 [Trichinella spiralis]|uniref:Glycerol-3-phosphate acyltransferase 3 n=1 Tax=Trichinella spiralis TaxID=6334 RepID=A0A0V1BRI5_TRISP|nr:Glycerol-3-phosphate acyltransferase 3 [Trichinella spiralis]
MRNRKVIYNLLFILFLDIIAFSSILPLFPSILNYYATKSLKLTFFVLQGDLYEILSNTIKIYCQAIGLPDNERLISVFFGGALGSLFSGLQFISSPWFGAMSDIYGRKWMLLISLAGTFTSYLLWSCASSFGIFMLSRIIGGLSKASTSISIAIVADLFPPEERGKGMAFVGLAFSSGFVIGPTLGAIAAYWNRMKTISVFTPAYFALLITSIEFLWVWIFLKETLPEVKKKKHRNLAFPQFFSYINPASLFVFKPLEERIEQKVHQKIKRTGLVYFLFLFIYSGLEFTLTFFAHERFNFNSMQQGKMFFYIGIIMIIIQGGYVRKIKTEKQKATASKGITVSLISFLAISLAWNVYYFYGGLTLYSLGKVLEIFCNSNSTSACNIASGIVVPCLTTEVSSQVSPTEKGSVLGIFRALGSLARAIGPVCASTVFWLFGDTITYIIGGLLMTVVLLAYIEISLNDQLCNEINFSSRNPRAEWVHWNIISSSQIYEKCDSSDEEFDENHERASIFLNGSIDAKQNHLIEREASEHLINKMYEEPSGCAVTTVVQDALDFTKAGIEAIIEDDVTSRFSAAELTSWNLLTRSSYGYHLLNWKLGLLWGFGLIIRYFVIFPINLTILVIALFILIATGCTITFIRDEQKKRKISRSMSLVCYRILLQACSGVVTFHNRHNSAKPGGICVANHTSPIDALVLACDNCYAFNSLLKLDAHIWFDREEGSDKLLVRNRLREHVQDHSKLPILIFPEGTCINNTSVMMFRKGSFEVGDVIYPVAIKYDARFGDAFWNSSKVSYFEYLMMMMTSWALVCDVWYLPPMVRQDGEDAIAFASRVKKAIAKAGGLVELEWDGQLKRHFVKSEVIDKQRQKYSERIMRVQLDDDVSHMLHCKNSEEY